MKKVSLFLLLLPLQAAYAQIQWGDYSQTFPEGTLAKPAAVGLIVTVRKANDAFMNAPTKDNALEALTKDAALDSAFRRIGPATVVYRSIFDTTKAHLFLHGVNPGNASAYEFKVSTYPSNRLLIPWRSIDQFTDSTLNKQSGMPTMAYLGGYKAPFGQTIIVKVRQKSNHQNVADALMTWSLIRPTIAAIYTSENLDAFFKKLQYPWARDTNPAQANTPVESLSLAPTNTNLVVYLGANTIHKEQLQYELVQDHRVVRPWANNAYDNSFIWLKENAPGAYQLRIRYTVQPQNVTTYRFNIAPAWYQSQRVKLMGGILVVMGLGAFVFLVLFIRQRQKNRRELVNKTKLQLELKAIHAQLNPHFVFNALSSIQGLVNKQDIEGANKYLANFARLMRESLTNSNKEEVALQQEIQSLETYLSLEQLRFGFQYQIAVNESVNRYDTNIPSLLMQPLVENAVKHGVANRQEAGLIAIRFDQLNDSMVVQITDNGRGFTNKVSTGFGLKLTRDRIALLNKLNPGQPIQLDVSAHLPTGVTVSLRFNHWFV